MADKAAIRPDVFTSQLPVFIKEKQAEAKGVSEEEQQLAGMSRSGGWRILKEFIETIREEMDELNEAAVAKGASFEQLGQNTLVITQTKGVLRKIVNKVEDAKEAVEKQGESK